MLTTVLTIYALFGDDLRLAFTHKDQDDLFNSLTLVCLLVFCIEMVASVLGQDGYWLGFFFWLDLGATTTLCFDLTWIWNTFICNGSDGNDGGSGALKTSRAGRAGARAARTVRIIRLIRLAKLYKTYKRATEERKRKGAALKPGEGDAEAPPAEEDEDEDDDLLSENASGDGQPWHEGAAKRPKVAESRVGKKLSDMTTRRVIVLVLVMLFVMPMFATTFYGFEELMQTKSADLGAELIYDRLRQWCLATQPPAGKLPWCLEDVEPADAAPWQTERAWLEDYVLHYLYDHKSGSFAWRLYWLGLGSEMLERHQVDHAARLSSLGQMNTKRLLGEEALPAERLSEWHAKFSNAGWQSPVAEVEETVVLRLMKPWTERCLHFYGVSLDPALDKDAQETDGRACSYLDELRCSEMQAVFPAALSKWEKDHLSVMFVFDIRTSTSLDSALSILQTIFICLAVGIGSMLFSNDANQLLLNPIERMISKMEMIKDDPLYAMKLGDIEYRTEEIKKAKFKQELDRMNRCSRWLYMRYHERKTKEPMETIILEKTIIKLGGLLALGFGEAGAEIIGYNMRASSTAGMAMVPGRKVDAIVGFCGIRHFMHATEVLKEQVMLFVNQIGEIVHGCVDDYYGAPNKNLGDCFLLVWRLSGLSRRRQTKLADLAIASAVRMIAEVNKSRVLAAYREHPGLLQRVSKYRVELGFGLHCGWAIEGSIGSEYKIDATYLSPNVNVSAGLEAATEQFSVLTLISHFMVNLCTPEVAKYCRLIDNVTVKGSKHPIRLYTVDLDYMRLKVNPKKKAMQTKNRFKLRQLREEQRNKKFSDDYVVHKAFDVDEDVKIMRSTFSSEFFLRFSMAFRNYEAGEWLVARDMLLTCHYLPENTMDFPSYMPEEQWPVDGPTRTLLRFMRQTGYHPTASWPGHREL